MREEIKAEKKWRWQEAQNKKREVSRERVIMEIKCFVCGGFGHITHHCRNVESRQKERPTQRFLNKFEVPRNRVINIKEGSGQKIRKDRKMILKEKILKEEKKEKKEKTVEVRKIEERKILREMTVKIGLKQKEDEEEIIVEALLDSGVTGLVMSLEFAKKNKVRKKKLDKLIYMRNVYGIFNHERLIEHTVKIKLLYRGHKKKTETDIIGNQKQNVILEMP